MAKFMPLLRAKWNDPLRFIPWAAIEPHAAQAMANHGQTLEKIADRGGLSPSEALAIIEDRRFSIMPRAEAETRLARLVSIHPPASPSTGEPT